MLQHYVWYREQPHQRVIVAADKNSELASPVVSKGDASERAKDTSTPTGQSPTMQKNIPPTELEAQRRSVEPKI